MIVISDTSPLITFLKSDTLYVLGQLYDKVEIPVEVYREIIQNNKYLTEAAQITNADFIFVNAEDIKNEADIIQLEKRLDRGEAEAIALLQKEKGADVLLIDERRGRKIAQEYGIPYVGSIGVLVEAFEQGVIDTDDVVDIIDSIRESKLRISESLLDSFRNMTINKTKEKKYER